MAEKEERIFCIETDEKIVECGYGDFYNTMPKKEVIKRMAKAFNSVVTILSEEACLEGTEAALNALIEKGE